MQPPPDPNQKYPQQQWQQPLAPQQQWYPQQPQYQPPMQLYPPYQQPSTPPKKSHKTLFIVLGVVLLPLLACIVISALVVGGRLATQQAMNATATQTALAEQVINSAYQPVDGVYCDQLEQTAYHIHAHLTIWIDGQQVVVPQGVGIASDQSCLYWLHTHDRTGVIHIEAPQTAALTLENFLDIWGQEFSQLGYHNELASSAGWTIYVDGKQVQGDFKSVVLTPHEVITIMYNSPNAKPDTDYSFQPGL